MKKLKYDYKKGWRKCKQCGTTMNPVDAYLSKKSQLCGKCIRKKHKKVIGK